MIFSPENDCSSNQNIDLTPTQETNATVIEGESLSSSSSITTSHDPTSILLSPDPIPSSATPSLPTSSDNTPKEKKKKKKKKRISDREMRGLEMYKKSTNFVGVINSQEPKCRISMCLALLFLSYKIY